ncbi:MAG: XRE family transcriptional regulator [Polyangiaceae bacterium]|nr:XRE family transcriptional regulator [Polyangiaceae bacterium]MCL4755402.1 XRE family transcriptional regulator [Myxococcales bacterium]
MSPEELKALQKELGISASELARALKVEPKTVVLWESGELFPTKRHVELMRELRERGRDAFPRAPRGKSRGVTGMARLSDPKLWELVRKLAAHPGFFDQVAKLAEELPDPAKSDEQG